MNRLEGKVAVITGGASGMGRDTAFRFMDEGAKVVIADLNENSGEETLGLAGQNGQSDSIRFIRTNVAEEADVEAMIRLALDEFGRLDCVFNNAGIGGAFGPITQTTVEEWDFSMAVLLRGVFLGMKHGAKAMLDQGEGGSIISTASVAGLGGGAGPHCYSAAKSGVVNLTRSVANELGPHFIRVNAIAPGAIMTPLLVRRDRAEMEKRMIAHQSLPEAGEGKHIAATAAFLASDDAQFINGQTIVVDGGLMAVGPGLFRNDRSRALSGMAGLDKGTTGEESVIRRPD